MTQTINDHLLEEQDREFIRVLEDLIELLVAQGVINLDMLPNRAAAKFAQRRAMRAQFVGMH